jgi:hypothetical protein
MRGRFSLYILLKLPLIIRNRNVVEDEISRRINVANSSDQQLLFSHLLSKKLKIKIKYIKQ